MDSDTCDRVPLTCCCCTCITTGVVLEFSKNVVQLIRTILKDYFKSWNIMIKAETMNSDIVCL